MSMHPSLETRSPRQKSRLAYRTLPAVIASSAAALLGGCSLPYYWQAVAGQLSLMSKQVPIETVIEDPRTSEQTREALRTVQEIRRFAEHELGLPANDSYATYVDLASSDSANDPDADEPDRSNGRRERDAAVWTVVAAEEFSIDPRTWCYPFAGCVSYRGYFNEAAASRYAARLQAEGMDVLVGGAAAYSTLGYFADPVVSSMLDGPDHELVEVLIHELAHQKFYLRGDSDLNEAFATAVAAYGTQLWLSRFGDADSLAAYRERILVQTQFAELISRQRERLRAIYAGPESPEEKRRAKEAAFETLRMEYAALTQLWNGRDYYEAWISAPLNNAHIASVATYRYWVPGLRRLLETKGLDAYYDEVEALGGLDADERRLRLQGWRELALEPADPGSL